MVLNLAAGPGFGPGFHPPEGCVLPLHHPATLNVAGAFDSPHQQLDFSKF